MAETSFGLNHPLAVKLWSKKLFHEALKSTYFGRFMGTGSDNLIQIKSETSKDAGDKITFGLRMQLSGDGTGGDDTLEGNEEALTLYNDAVYIDQLRHAVVSGGKMSEQRVPFSVREEARMGLQDWFSGRFDTAMFNQLAGRSGIADTRYTGSQAAPAPTKVMVGGFGAGAHADTTEASLSATTTHTLQLRDLDALVAFAKTTSPMIRPIMIGGKPHYLCFIHPNTTFQLRGQANAGQWADIQLAAMQGGIYKDNPIVTGALGVYNGVILHESAYIPNTESVAAGNTDYRRAIFCGAQAGVIAFGQGGSANKMKWNEEMFDYGNKLGVSAGTIYGLKKTQFNGSDFSVITVPHWAPAKLS
jgi:N4-gp56 family major capsid protein